MAEPGTQEPVQKVADEPTAWETSYYLFTTDEGERETIAINMVNDASRKYSTPVEEIHAWWKHDDFRDPLNQMLFIGWRSDWKEMCKNICDLHKAAERE